jgi:hypothetical protein
MWADRPTRHDLFSPVEPVTTASDGSFRFPIVHPGATYTLTCCPDAARIGVNIRLTGVAPGREDLAILLTARQILGSSISGRVVAADTGEPIGDFAIQQIHYRPDGTVRGVSDVSSAIIDSGLFTLPDLSIGSTYTFAVRPADFAPALVGPIEATAAARVVDVRVERWGAIECRLLDEGARPFVNTMVAIEPVHRLPGVGHRGPVPTDAAGMLVAAKLAPGEHQVYVIRDGSRSPGKTVQVIAGKTTAVELRLPR